MNPELEKARDHFIETAGHLSTSLGLSEIAGRLYALLYLSPDPISLNEMVDMLKISKASASVNIRTLEGWGAARKVWVKGNRRDHYTADRDIWKLGTNRLKTGLERRMSEANGAMEQAEEMLKNSQEKFNGDAKKLAATYIKRIKAIRETTEKLERLLTFIPSNL